MDHITGDYHPYIANYPEGERWGVSFGGGTNSTAMLLAMLERGLTPRWIVFADTGAELPRTYSNLSTLSAYLTEVGGFPPIHVTRWERTRGDYRGFVPIDKVIADRKTLPPPSFRFRGCSIDYKVRPVSRWLKNNSFDDDQVAIGFDAGEIKRIHKRMRCSSGDDMGAGRPWFPLYAWGMTRSECECINARHGFSPGKSSCYMCPYLKVEEWDAMSIENPDLFKKAVAIHNAAVDNGRTGVGGKGLFINGLPHTLKRTGGGRVEYVGYNSKDYLEKRRGEWVKYKENTDNPTPYTWTEFVLLYDHIYKSQLLGSEDAKPSASADFTDSCMCGL